MRADLENRVFTINSDKAFSSLALDIFKYQSVSNCVYSKFLSELGCKIDDIKSIDQIPFLPISLFKNCEVRTGVFEAETIFKSSGTSYGNRSNHYVKSLKLYQKSLINGFTRFYGDAGDLSIYALLPSYLENGDSSLVYMADKLINMNSRAKGGFFLNEYKRLFNSIRESLAAGEKVMLIGVTYALLDFADLYGGNDFSDLIVVETGGMKGRRREMLRDEVHGILKEAFGLKIIHSEYGMTELLSQAWSTGDGLFGCPPWMSIVIRDPHDPAGMIREGHSGGINVIDLANIYSCSFIETSDLGVANPDGSFEVIGRFDNSDLRGCNLLV